ncbi:MAG: hypothetical protein OEY38_16720 [Gammaproteobacteria bacterium]|nr:hypothetical protein [Gammaproteobacteria bacterium]
MKLYLYMKNFALTVIVTFVIFLSAHASPVKLKLPLLDYPFVKQAPNNVPSMHQSMQLSQSFYNGAHYLIFKKLKTSNKHKYYTSLLFDFVTTWTPLGTTWLHEEWHRAVMGQYGIKSFDDVNRFPFFSDAISVSKVKDEDLVRLKQLYPADMVRLTSAGFEASNVFSLHLQKNQFFDNYQLHMGFNDWVQHVNSWFYLDTCASNEADAFTQRFLKEENQDVSKRDFAGLDCTAWVYDLFRPDGPYSSRGIHPSGTGIDRYIQFSDLTLKEKHYLIKQRNLFLINFIDPFLFGFTHFSLNTNNTLLYWNANMEHYLAPFGHAITINTFLKFQQYKLMLSLHRFSNEALNLPGYSFEIHELPFVLGTQNLNLSIRTSLWRQPRQLLFSERSVQLGGLISASLNSTISQLWHLSIQTTYKSKGWEPGQVYLGQQWSSQIALFYVLP